MLREPGRFLVAAAGLPGASLHGNRSKKGPSAGGPVNENNRIEGTCWMIAIEADVHKSTHALGGVDVDIGQLLDERETRAKEQHHLGALRWARELDHEIVWAIEDCREHSHHLEHALVAASERVLWGASKLMGASRVSHSPTGGGL